MMTGNGNKNKDDEPMGALGPNIEIDPAILALGQQLGAAVQEHQELQTVAMMAAHIAAVSEGTFDDAAKDAWALWDAVIDARPKGGGT